MSLTRFTTRYAEERTAMTDLKELKRKALNGDMEAYYELLDEYERRKKEKKNEINQSEEGQENRLAQHT